MTRNTFYAAVMMAIMVMTGTTAYAQRHGEPRRGGERMEHNGYRGSFNGGNRDMRGGGDFRGGNRDMNRGRMDVNRGRMDMHRGNYAGRYEGAHRPNAVAFHNAPRYDRNGFVPGWENRVRHENGRWGYYRDNRWYWYNRYFDPTYYYARPLAHFNDYYYIADGGYIPGWEGRVLYRDGRWGYLRGSDWYWYDRYYEPDYYFAHPVAHFHGHHISPAGRVVNGVATAIVLGSVLSAICN